MKISPRISGFGSFTPPRIVTNHELARRVDTSDEWIVTRTGIHERRIADPGTKGTDLALAAAKSALERSGHRPEEITHIFYATCTPDAACPPSACILARKLGLKGVTAFDFNAVCSGFVYGLELARNTVLADPAACVLLVASEVLSLRCNWQDRSTCVLFGDGAGAVLITSGNRHEPPVPSVLDGQIIDIALSSDGALGDLLQFGDKYYTLDEVVGPEFFIHMQGREVFKHAVRNMGNVCRLLLERNELAPDDVDVLVPHQANLRIIEAVGSRLGVPVDKVFVNVGKYGNTSAASIPLALSDALDANFILPGMRVLLATFGGGFTWGAALVQF